MVGDSTPVVPETIRTRTHGYCGSVVFSQEIVMSQLLSPMLADYIWVGGGTLGTILVVVLIVFLLRR